MPDTMRAQVFVEPMQMGMQVIPIPRPAEDEVLVRVKACGICGSDLSYYYGHSPLGTPTGKGPLVLGHEYTGEVVEVGSIPRARGLFQVGDRVVINPVQHCNTCDVCNRGQTNLCRNVTVPGVTVNGGLAEYSASKYWATYKLPDNVSYEQGAFIEPLACATYAMKKLDIQLGQSVAIIGAGVIGLMMTQMAKAAGAGQVILVGTRDYRLEAGRGLGADVLINTREPASPYYAADLAARIRELTDGRMVERAITPTASVPAMEQAIAVTGPHATIVYFGLPGPEDIIRVPALPTITSDKTIKFSWLAPLVWPTAIDLIRTGIVKVEPLLSRQFPLEESVRAIEYVRDRQGNALKCQIVP